MKNNVYESAVLINAALDDEQINGIINRIKEMITNNGGKSESLRIGEEKGLPIWLRKAR